MTKDETREVAVEASGWTEPRSKLIYREGYDAGYDAAMARTCEWVMNGPLYETGCGNAVPWAYYVGSTYCSNCGGRVVVKEAK